MFILSVREYYDSSDEIKDKLEEFGKDGHLMLTIVDFTYTRCVCYLMGLLNSEFDSDVGNKAYPREMLFMVVLYCLMNGINELDAIERECRLNKVLNVVTMGMTPDVSTFRRFFINSKPRVIKTIFLYTIVMFNDYGYINFLKLYIDSTDALVRASRNYILTDKKIEAFKFLNEHDIIHDLSKKSKKRLLEELERIEKEDYCDEKIMKYIRLVRSNLNFFNSDIFEKLPQLERIMEERGLNKISITFPDSVMMKTKRGRTDFAFNVHEIMTEEKIVLTPFLSNLPNDKKCLEDIIIELIDNVNIILELQRKFGERSNYKEIEGILKKSSFMLDSGYYEIENIKTGHEYELNIIILPKRISTQINNQIRKDNDLEVKDKNKKNPDKMSKKALIRVLEGYQCPKGFLLKLRRQWEIQKRDGSHKELPPELREHTYEYHCSHCKGCEYQEKCDLETITEKMTPLEYEMVQKSLKKPSQRRYKPRFHCSEGINGYLKGKEGILQFMISDITACQNQLYFLNLGYNLTRFVNMKGTLY